MICDPLCNALLQRWKTPQAPQSERHHGRSWCAPKRRNQGRDATQKGQCGRSLDGAFHGGFGQCTRRKCPVGSSGCGVGAFLKVAQIVGEIGQDLRRTTVSPAPIMTATNRASWLGIEPRRFGQSACQGGRMSRPAAGCVVGPLQPKNEMRSCQGKTGWVEKRGGSRAPPGRSIRWV